MVGFSVEYHFGTSLPTLNRSSDFLGAGAREYGLLDFATIDLEGN